MNIEKRLTNLENFVFSLLKINQINNNYTISDIEGCRHTEFEQQKSIKTNADGITDTQMALCDNYEMIEVGNQQITDLEMAICDIYEMIAEGE